MWVTRKLVMFGFFCFINGLKMPKYLKSCRENDPELNKCALKNGNDAIPYIVKGDRHYRIPNMIPFRVSLIEVDGGDSFNVKMRDLEIYGIDRIKLADIDINIPEKKIKIILKSDLMEVGGTYEIDAKFLVLPIKGTGPANITLYNPVLTYTQEWGLKMKKGEFHLYIKNSQITYDVTKAIYNFDNLFNGNEELGNTNPFF
ncbi:hypothetical protein WA026_003896 [Henosepilachna vigintioctopunctata]|uniref:Uncharacterized protein n=1 Tax=Henosepilachna vigintioctopunctata TaxID=420089 RepID=A0AAW1U8X0_9CUCU